MVDKDLALKTWGPKFACMEDGSGFGNFTRMTASDFELFVTIIGSKVSRQDMNYRKSITVNERLAVTYEIFSYRGLIPEFNAPI
jgi:hypothetical protein